MALSTGGGAEQVQMNLRVTVCMARVSCPKIFVHDCLNLT